MVNSNWIRWIKASFAKHFDSCKGSYGFIVEGSIKPDDLHNFFELRLDVTNLRLSDQTWKANIAVNILVSCDVSDTDLYLMERLVGTIAAGFRSFMMYKLGTGSEDNSTESIGCARLIELPGSETNVKISDFGQWNKDVQIQQGNVEGHFLAELGA